MKLGPKMYQQSAIRVFTCMWRRPNEINRWKICISHFEKCRTFSSNLRKLKLDEERSLKVLIRRSSDATCLQPEPIRVAITGAAGNIGYTILYMICCGGVFGLDQPLIVHLLELPPRMKQLGGVVMEIQDCAFPLVRGIVATDDQAVAFEKLDVAFLVGAFPRQRGMQRKDLLYANAKIFKRQGQHLDKHAKKTVKVLIVGNPVNTNALICSQFAPSIPPENIHALTRLDENRALAQIAIRLNVHVSDVKNIVVWGNHSATQFPDVRHATVNVKGKDVNVVKAINDDKWLTSQFLKTVRTRGAAIIAARKKSSVMSAAKASCDHMRDLWLGTPEGRFVSMGVISDGSYGAPKDVVFSFPVTVQNKQWKIVQDLPMDDFARCMLEETGKELIEERKEAFHVIGM